MLKASCLQQKGVRGVIKYLNKFPFSLFFAQPEIIYKLWKEIGVI